MRRLFAVLVFLTVVVGLLGAVHYAFYDRLIVSPDLGPTWVRLGGLALTALAVAMPVGIAMGRRGPPRLRAKAAGAAYSWMGVMFMLLSALGIGELVRVALASSVPEPQLSRGIAAAVAGVVAVATVWGIYRAVGPVPVKRVEVRLSRLPASMAGFKLVQLTDVHIGPTLGRAWLSTIVEQVNALDADAVAITGDLVDGSVERLRDDVAPLGELRSRHGTFFVTGNHEYYSGADAWIAELRRLGVRVLRNERVAIGDDDGFDIAGVDDWTAFGEGHGPDLASALEGRDPNREVVLLAHQPRQIAQAAEAGVGLQISGHTHGGQIVPWNIFVRLQQPHVAGLTRRGDTQLYTSCGTGYWGPPMRVGAPPEITLLELQPASA